MVFQLILRVDICKEKKIEINIEEFNVLMKEQKERSKDKNQFQQAIQVNEPNLQTEFVGYNCSSVDSEVLGIFKDDEKIGELKEGRKSIFGFGENLVSMQNLEDKLVILEQSLHPHHRYQVLDTKKFNRMFLHDCVVEKGTLKATQSVSFTYR